MAMEINDIVGGRGGFGFGGGGDGMGVLLGLLLARGGVLGNDRGNDCVTQSDLNGKTLGDVKGEIKDAESILLMRLVSTLWKRWWSLILRCR